MSGNNLPMPVMWIEIGNFPAGDEPTEIVAYGMWVDSVPDGAVVTRDGGRVAVVPFRDLTVAQSLAYARTVCREANGSRKSKNRSNRLQGALNDAGIGWLG